jgi:hypothetical protein
MKGHRSRKCKYPNFWKIYNMNAVQLFVLERAVELVTWRRQYIRTHYVHWIGRARRERARWV